MPLIVKDGVKVRKKEGECAHPTCTNAVDLRKNEILPQGWGTIAFNRMTKSGGVAHQTLLICPEHTLSFTERQTTLDWREKRFTRVVIESPFAGDDATIERNLRYVRLAMRHCLLQGEAPFPSHALYTQPGVLDDRNKEERKLGIEAGLAWGEAGQKAVVYTDLGVTPGMEIGIERHLKNGVPVEKRRLPDWNKE